MDIIGNFGSLIDKLLWRNDDDVYDRLSHRWTPALLVGFALFVTANQYVGDAIHCWAPVHFTGSWKSYTDSYCWIRNTYYLPFDEEIPIEHENRRTNPVLYYQWVPLFLAVQALLFYLPVLIWRGMNSRTGIDLNDIIETAEKFQKSSDDVTAEKTLKFMCQQTHRYMGCSKKEAKKGILRGCSDRVANTIQHIFTPCFGKYFGTYVTSVYVLVKLLMLANVIGQLFLLNVFLGFDFHLYGFYVVSAMVAGRDWTESPRFPRVTLCDFDVRRFGNVQTYTVQCVLTINLFNEKVYLIIWFWLLFVAFMTAMGIALLLARIIYQPDRSTYIMKHLVCDNVYDPNKDKELLDRFVHQYLRLDGVIMLRLVGHNTNKVVVNEFISALFGMFKRLQLKDPGMEDTPLLPAIQPAPMKPEPPGNSDPAPMKEDSKPPQDPFVPVPPTAPHREDEKKTD